MMEVLESLCNFVRTADRIITNRIFPIELTMAFMEHDLIWYETKVRGKGMLTWKQ